MLPAPAYNSNSRVRSPLPLLPEQKADLAAIAEKGQRVIPGPSITARLRQR